MKTLSVLVLSLSLLAPLARAEDGGDFEVDANDVADSLFQNAWNECAGEVTGNYTGIGCATKRGMAAEFEAYLRANVIPCANFAVNRIDPDSVVKHVHLIHDGVMADSAHSRKSLHAVGRAIDVQQVKVTLADGTSRSYDFRVTSTQPQSASRAFFEGFRSCWARVNVRRGCDYLPSGNPLATIGWEDSRHRSHHLHTSMPFCPNPRGFMRTVDGVEEEMGTEYND